MRILFYRISYIDYDLSMVFKELHIEFDELKWKFETNERDEKFLKWFDSSVDVRKYDAVFSIDYWPPISLACQKAGIMYIAWSYDTPPNVKDIEDTLGNSVNRVFWFDKTQYQKYKDSGFDNVYHLPLGVNKTRLSNLKVSDADHRKYDTDISLVGKLYESDFLMFRSLVDETYQKFFDMLVDTQGKIFDQYIIDNMFTPAIVSGINQNIVNRYPKSNIYIPMEALTYAIASEVTRRERIVLLSLCGQRYKTRLYSYQDNDIIKNVERFPAVDYVGEMPLVFNCSKINLNPAFCMIQSGVSLRALDIMGAGGFLLSRCQSELRELYRENEDFVFYENYEDAVAKIDFYIQNEDIRGRIAANGRKRTLEKNSLQERVKTIFYKVNLC